MPDIAVETLAELIARRDARPGYPKYLRVFDAFAEGIRSGKLKPGQRIPAESRLCDRLPVSLGTLQKAMSRLAQCGFIVRHRKSGTFVARRSSQAAEAFVFRFRDPRTGRMLLPLVRVLAVTEDRSRGPWRDALGVRRCVRLDRLLCVDRDPPAFASVYFSYPHGKGLLNAPIEQLHGSSMHRLLLESFHLPPLRFEHRIGCRALSETACEHLRVPAGTVGTVWDVCEFSVQDKPVLFQRLQLPPVHRPLEISERLPG
ncbi:MAG TPA: GntR family transcriptional regulator [Woeseiaceae bacterium]|jgi:DNA-binding GntR family transcriptional regulator|nr:GntR family transcriptional regulator [Woeseiaceae bacterium]